MEGASCGLPKSVAAIYRKFGHMSKLASISHASNKNDGISQASALPLPSHMNWLAEGMCQFFLVRPNFRREMARLSGNKQGMARNMGTTSTASIKWRKPAGDGTPFLVIQAIGKKEELTLDQHLTARKSDGENRHRRASSNCCSPIR